MVTIIGTVFNDNNISGLPALNGTFAGDKIYGLGGSDIINGGGGGDRIFGDRSVFNLPAGAPGNDVIRGGGGDDRIYGDGGNDTMIWNLGDGRDFINGGAGLRDVARFNGSNSTLVPFRDRFVVQNGDWGRTDVLRNGLVIGDIATTEQIQINGNAGNDSLLVGNLGATGVRSVRYSGGNGQDFLNGKLNGVLTNTSLIAFGGKGDDKLNGGNNPDILRGGLHNDILRGRRGADRLFGDAGTDLLIGGRGNDFMVGGTGIDDRLKSGSRFDRDVFRFNDIKEGRDFILDFDTFDRPFDLVNDSDVIQILNIGFNPTAVGISDLPGGVLPNERLVKGFASLGSNAGFRYFQGSGNLFFDPNGGNILGSRLLATLNDPSTILDVPPTFEAFSGSDPIFVV